MLIKNISKTYFRAVVTIFTLGFAQLFALPSLLHSQIQDPWISKNLFPRPYLGQPASGVQNHGHYGLSIHSCLIHQCLGRRDEWSIFHPLHQSTLSQQARNVESCHRKVDYDQDNWCKTNLHAA